MDFLQSKTAFNLALTLMVFLIIAAVMLVSNIANENEAMRKEILNSLEITIGRKEPCIATVSYNTWEAMNELEIYRWVVACEESVGI